MMTVRCYLAPSTIEGLGIFAAETIAKGDLIWRFEPQFDQILSLDYSASLPDHVREFLERYSYAHPTDASRIVLDADEGRFMNHSETPNTDFSTPEIGVALSAISRGEELTCDYRQFTAGEVIHQPPRHQVHLSANGQAATLPHVVRA